MCFVLELTWYVMPSRHTDIHIVEIITTDFEDKECTMSKRVVTEHNSDGKKQLPCVPYVSPIVKKTVPHNNRRRSQIDVISFENHVTYFLDLGGHNV